MEHVFWIYFAAEFVEDVLAERICPRLAERIAELSRAGYLGVAQQLGACQTFPKPWPWTAF